MKLALTTLLLLSACATVTGGGNQPIRVVTEPEGAACSVHNKEGHWEIEKTPATVAVERSFSPLKITCAHEGESPPMEATLEPRTRGRAYGNLLLLGVPAVVDTATGEGYEYSPDSVTLKAKY